MHIFISFTAYFTLFHQGRFVFVSKNIFLVLHVNSCVANVHSVTGLPQKKGVNPNYYYNHTEIKHVKGVSCVDRLNFANIVTNAPAVVVNPPVGARLHQFWEKWEALGSSPKVVTILREGYTLPFRVRPNLTYTNSQSVQEVHAFSHPGSVLPVQSPTLWSVYSTHGVHSGGQRGQTDGFTEGYKNPPVPRRLLGESHIPPNL